MRIAIEAQRIFRPNKHGMDFVALESIRCLQQIDHENEYFILVAPGEDHCLQSSDNMHIVELPSKGGYPFWEQYALPKALKKIKPDILHCTGNTAPIFCDIPLVLTLHDIIFLEKKTGSNSSLYQKMGWYYRRLVVPQIFDKAHRIISVSKFECDRIKEFLNLPSEKIKVVYNGFSKHFTPLENLSLTSCKYIDSDDYLFFLGNTDPKKNTSRVLKAYSIYLKNSEKKRPLLIADLKEPVVKEILAKENISDIMPYIHCPGYIKNSDLPAIYSGAFAFLYPSLRESFGIPLIEAMACGAPVVSSDVSAIPEIASDAALLVDPLNPEEIANAVLKLEADKDLYTDLVSKGFERTKEFSWMKTAGNLLDIYKEVYNELIRN